MIELISPEFYKKDFLGPAPTYRIIGRPKPSGSRHYAVIFRREPGENEDPNMAWYDPRVCFYPGVTTVNSKTTPTSSFLISWIAKHGADKAEELRDSAAARGTIMHSYFVAVARNEVMGFETKGFQADMEKRIIAQGFDPAKYPEWKEFFIKSIMSFIQWVNDYNVVFYALEIGLVSRKDGYAGQLDVICEMNAKDYTEKTPVDKRERTLALVDFKSGENFYDEHVTQLGLYIPLLLENFPAMEGRKIQVYNWAPNDFKKGPTYKFKNQSPYVNHEECAAMLALFKTRQKPDSFPDVTTYKGRPRLGMDASELAKTETFEKHWEDLVADLLAPGPAKRKRGRPKLNPTLADLTPKEIFRQLEIEFV